MSEEGCGVMEKKLPPRQLQTQPKNNGAISEKKSDYVSNKNGQQRKYKQTNNGGRSVEPSTQNTKPVQKYGQTYSDKRPRPRGYFNDRHGEQVAGANDDIFDTSETTSRKGNANYLLKFSFAPRGEDGRYDSHRSSAGGGGRFSRGGGYRTRRRTFTPVYSPEQFLQASCQFVVREDGEYTEQAINPDCLVNWDLVEQVRTFSAEPVVCPICLQAPAAGKITKCGHVYCWSCILHHLQEKELMCRKLECPICPHRIEPDELRSVMCVETQDYKVGDEIEMKLMRKSKGSVYVCPKSEWKDREGKPHNIDDGSVTLYMKLLSATNDQIKEHVINKEKEDLQRLMLEAEEYETSYIEIARGILENREDRLKMKIRAASLTESEKDDKLSDNPAAAGVMQPGKVAAEAVQETEPSIKYADAFEDEEEESISETPSMLETSSITVDDDDDGGEDDTFLPGGGDEDEQAATQNQVAAAATEDVGESPLAGTCSCPELSQLPLRAQQQQQQQYGMYGLLTPEEAADHLELPEGGGGAFSQQRSNGRNKDTYYFYQASSGQHIYLHSLNAQCLTRDYGSLENSPEIIKAKIVAIERIFMTEDVRKRLRYLNHIPLTCEFHVVELKFQSPLISRETLQYFHSEFDKRRKARQRKKKEEKERAKQHDVEHKKSFGIYPEVQIPLDSLTQFPANFGNSGSPAAISGEPVGGLSDASNDEKVGSPEICNVDAGVTAASTPTRQRNDSEGSQSGLMSFAQMLKMGKSVPQTTMWGRAVPQGSPLHVSATSPELSSASSAGGRGAGTDDNDEGDDYLPAPPMASSWFDDIGKAMDAHISRHQVHEADDHAADSQLGTNGGNKKKKKKSKEKQLLFSTSMIRKG